MTSALRIQIRGAPVRPSWEGTVRAVAQQMAFEPEFSFTASLEANLVEVAGEVPLSASQLLLPPVAQNSETVLRDVEVRFSDDLVVPPMFRARTLRQRLPAGEVLPASPGTRILACTPSGPIWTLASNAAGASRYRSAFAIPAIHSGCNLADVFNGDRFMQLLPLVHLLRELWGRNRLCPPPLRACFIFDDPNLHWPRYGHVDYREIVSHALRHNFHVSFATVPLDNWFTHGQTAALFRSHPDRLSLCVHGNDHVKRELAQKFTAAQRGALLQQALRRIGELERVSGVKVARVMVPPHGACSDAMLTDLPQYGFEAACISHGSLRAHNPEQPWVAKLGVQIVEVIRGCPVMPRWAMTGNVQNAVLLAAYLGQPIVLRGHHQDLKGGVEVLDTLANFINGLGEVVWRDMSELSTMGYVSQQQGAICRVKPLGLRVIFPVHAECEVVVADIPDLFGSGQWMVGVGNQPPRKVQVGEEVRLLPGQSKSLSFELKLVAPPVALRPRRTSVSAVVRRLLTEGRDRLRVN